MPLSPFTPHRATIRLALALCVTFCGTVTAQPTHLVAEGDSITYGRTAPMGSDYPSITARATCAGVLHNYAVSASRMVDLIDREEMVDIAFRVDAWNVLVVLAGSNDLADGADPVAIHGAVAAYLARRRARGYETFALTVLPRADVAEGPRQAFNALLRSSERVVELGTIATVDGIHPGEAGFAIMAGMVADAIRPLAPTRCPLPWARVTRPHPPAAE
jgi:hypothetical protein